MTDDTKKSTDGYYGDIPSEEDVEAQVIPEVAIAATPFILLILTSIFRSAISFFTWRWLEKVFPKKKEEQNDERTTD